MLYKEFEKELMQHCENECSKYIGTALCSSFSKWREISNEISSELNTFLLSKNKLIYCEINHHVFFYSSKYIISVKSEIAEGQKCSYSSIPLLCLSVSVTSIDTTDNDKIIKIVPQISRLCICNQELDNFFITPHPYLKSFLNKKIKMKDDINELSEIFYKEQKKEFDYRYFNFLRSAVEKAFPIYQNHMFLKTCLTEEFSCLVRDFDFFIVSTKNIALSREKRNSLRTEIARLFSQKRIYSAKFEIFENGDKKEEKYFPVLPMSLVKYQYNNFKEIFSEAAHVPACGTALIRITITNVATQREKTVDDCFNY